jgi:hypothetical protein
MNYTENGIGRAATFLIPGGKLRHRRRGALHSKGGCRLSPIEVRGYTTSVSNFRGYWVSPVGKKLGGEHSEYRVFLNGGKATDVLKSFLAEIAIEIGRQCICFETVETSSFIFPRI